MCLKLQDQKEMIRGMLTNRLIGQYHMIGIANETENHLFLSTLTITRTQVMKEKITMVIGLIVYRSAETIAS